VFRYKFQWSLRRPVIWTPPSNSVPWVISIWCCITFRERTPVPLDWWVEGWFGWAPYMNWMTWHRKKISEKCRQETKCFTQFRLDYSTNRWNPALYSGRYFLWKWSHILVLTCWLYSSILPPLPLLSLYQNICPGSRISVWTFRNMTRFYGEELLASLANPRLKYHPLSAVRDSLFNIFPATLHIGIVPPSATWGRAMPSREGPTYHGWKAISITYSECVYSLSSMQSACAILPSVACLALQCFSHCHKWRGFCENIVERKEYNSNKSTTRCYNFPIYYPDVYLQLRKCPKHVEL